MESKRCLACAEEILSEAIVCKHCGTRQDEFQASNSSSSKASKPKSKLIYFLLPALLALAMGSYVAWDLGVQQPAIQASEASASASAEAKAQKEQDRQQREEEAQANADRLSEINDRQSEINQRTTIVQQIEDAVSTLAAEHIKNGLISGKVLNTNCTPISGYSLENLQQSSTTFDCFVTTKDNGDGTQTGYSYTAVMDWIAGSYTYKLGDPN